MIRMNRWVTVGLAIMLCMIFTSACKPKSEPTSNKEQMEAPAKAKLDISFTTIPETPNPNILPTLQTTVKQNNKAVTDATVNLEVWKDGMTTHQMIKATHSKDGMYVADSPVKETGEYKVIVHVSTPNGLEQDFKSTYSMKKKSKCCEGMEKESTEKKKSDCCEGH